MITTGPDAALWFAPLILPVAGRVAFSDLKHMRIPNAAVVTLALGFFALGQAALPPEVWLLRCGQMVLVLMAGFALYLARLIGAGDAKFAAGAAPFIAAEDLRLVLALLSTTLLASFLAHRAARRTARLRGMAHGWASWTHSQFPLGLPLSATLVFYILAAAWFGP